MYKVQSLFSGLGRIQKGAMGCIFGETFESVAGRGFGFSAEACARLACWGRPRISQIGRMDLAETQLGHTAPLM